MSALFIGEVLPVVIGILGRVFDTYGAKEPIIKTLPDFGIVLIVYVIFGLLFWILYRFVNWKIVAGFALILAFSLEQWVYQQVEGDVNLTNTVSLGTIVEFLIVYLLVLVLPYWIFQKVKRQWTGRGILGALIVALLLNIAGLGFTYYTMVKTGWWQKHQGGSAGKQNQSEKQELLSAGVCPERLITAKDKQTSAIVSGREIILNASEQNWAETNCPKMSR